MAKKLEKEKIVYGIVLDPYKLGVESKDNKKIFIDGNPVALSVGTQIDMSQGFKCTLLIDVHYDSEHQETLTEQIPQLESFRNIVAINPKFKNKAMIEKLKELNILSKTLKIVNYNDQDYELVKVNIDELKLYKPFGDTVLKDYRDKEKQKDTLKGKEL